jgi:hypothetical protein
VLICDTIYIFKYSYVVVDICPDEEERRGQGRRNVLEE